VQQGEDATLVHSALFPVDVHVEHHRRQHLVEETTERTPPGVRGFLEDPFLRLAQQMRSIAPRGRQVVPVASAFGRVDQMLGRGVVECHPFEIEEEKEVSDLAALLLRRRHQRAVLGRARITRMEQVGVDRRLVGKLEDRLRLAQRFAEPCR
jgi:hypothetical protein